MPSLCIFVDGPTHDGADQRVHDQQIRAELEDHGFRIVVIRYDQSIDDQFDTLRQILVS